MKYNIQWLMTQLKTEEKIKYLFFWGHQQAKDGQITKSCFSQWWISPFTTDGIEYPSAEHWMMAGKAKMFNDEEILQDILKAKTPAEAKKLGRMVKNFDNDTWQNKCYELVVEGNKHKFSQNDDLKEFLLQTGDRILVEASPVDPVWGIGLTEDNPDSLNPEKWNGANLLGFALMEVRDQLKK